LELFKKLAKEKLSVPQKRVLAIVGLKLADDALELEEYGEPGRIFFLDDLPNSGPAVRLG
jgi:hypothetical protein